MLPGNVGVFRISATILLIWFLDGEETAARLGHDWVILASIRGKVASYVFVNRRSSVRI